MNEHDTIFDMASSRLRCGAGATAEVGAELADLGARRVLVVTDAKLAQLPPVDVVRKSLAAEGIAYEVFDRVRIEPSDASFREAIEFAQAGKFDAYVAVGGGSSIDTAKAANLYATHPAELLAYVNPPVGQGKPVPGPLRPLIAVPTTAGTGSETTGVAIFDLVGQNIKTGISHRWLKPTLGIIDVENTATLPPQVAACTGLDVLCHAIESFTAIPYDSRPKPARPSLRPPYQGHNPISDVWSLEALRMAAKYLFRAVMVPSDVEAREQMLLASAFAGIGFGNAGVHLPHAMSYPISGLARDFKPEEYDADHPLIPHGISVILTAPAVFRFTASACPERHRRAAEALLGINRSDATEAVEAGALLVSTIINFMRTLQMPNGLAAVGFTERDIPALVAGTLQQQRLTQLSPRTADEKQLGLIFADAMEYWDDDDPPNLHVVDL